MPGVIMATECKAFDKLYQLAELEEPRLVGMLCNIDLTRSVDEIITVINSQ